ncbi:centrosomal protein kizuna [Salmo salar]|uniref:Centrosomal protein kizuna n=1 Tax=Salmo salar TaxID=8030 RepID=A0A1S3N859_SALSA|nr:centrosomal protein kizuna-like [Salmo salar]|eukprot:XP_014011619.1 PREDICTED: centrosomal protein kizuna-like isoform X2 [Salmo salar]
MPSESSCLPPDAAPLWDPWFKHTLLLKDHRVLTTERLVQLFTPLLLPHNASYSTKAKVLQRTLLSRSSEECPSVEVASESSSCGLPSFPYDSDVEVQPVRPAQEHRAAGMQGLQSGEEDSQDESPVESIPIGETTKAYQLLKQSAMQERQQSSGDEEENLSDKGNHRPHHPTPHYPSSQPLWPNHRSTLSIWLTVP